MVRLIAFVALVVAGMGGALVLISERAAVTGAGYRVARLESERRRQLEANRKLEAAVAAARSPGALARRVRSLQLDLLPPEESLEQHLAKAKEAERAKAGDAASRGKRAAR